MDAGCCFTSTGAEELSPAAASEEAPGSSMLCPFPLSGGRQGLCSLYTWQNLLNSVTREALISLGKEVTSSLEQILYLLYNLLLLKGVPKGLDLLLVTPVPAAVPAAAGGQWHVFCCF